jgi:hypothetical protein
MLADKVDTLLRRTFVYFIKRYQQTTWTGKRFACAHRIRHGGESCSQFALKLFQDDRLWPAIMRLFFRFQQCADAAEALRSHAESHTRKRDGPTNGGAEPLERDPSSEGHTRAASYFLPAIQGSSRCCLLSLISCTAVSPDGPTISCSNSIFRLMWNKPLVETNRKSGSKSGPPTFESDQGDSRGSQIE